MISRRKRRLFIVTSSKEIFPKINSILCFQTQENQFFQDIWNIFADPGVRARFCPHVNRTRTRTGKPHRSKCLTTIFYFVFPFFQLSRTSDLVAGFDQNKNLWFLDVYGEYWSPFVRYCKRLLVLLTWRGIEPKNKELKNKCDVNLCSCKNDNFLRVLLLIFFVLISIAAENAYKWIKIYNQLTQHIVHF